MSMVRRTTATALTVATLATCGWEVFEDGSVLLTSHSEQVTACIAQEPCDHRFREVKRQKRIVARLYSELAENETAQLDKIEALRAQVRHLRSRL